MDLTRMGHREAGVSLFAELPERTRRAIVAASVPVSLPARAWLFREGEAGDAMFVIRSGRVEVLKEQPDGGEPPAVIGVMGRGAAFGELALLTGAPRVASVRARRDSELLRVDAHSFAALLGDDPALAMGLAHVLARLLQGGAAPNLQQDRLGVLAVVALQEGLPVRSLHEQLQRAFEREGRVATIDAPQAQAAILAPGSDQRHPPANGATNGAPLGDGDAEKGYARLLDRYERAHDVVLLLAGGGDVAADPHWTRFCLRQADHVLAITRADAPPPATPLEGLGETNHELCFVDAPSGPGHVGDWLDALSPRSHHFLRSGPGDRAVETVRRLVRRLTGRSVGVVLSGGGARGFAHLGVLATLEKAGIQVDRVGGCSMGSFMGALFASSRTHQEMIDLCRRELVERNPLRDYNLPRVSLVQGKKFRALLQRAFGDVRIEELPVDLFCVSADLVAAEVVVHRRGPLWEAVGTSMSIPGLVPPVANAGRLMVDGGVLNNLPIDVMAATGQGPVIAVDVMNRDFAASRAARRSPGAGHEVALPSIVETLMRITELSSSHAAELNRSQAALVITPGDEGTGVLQFERLDRMVEAGRRAAEAALDRHPDVVDTLTS